MVRLLLDLCKNFIEGGLDIANALSLSLIGLVFEFETTFWSGFGLRSPINMTKLSATILGISLSLITMKFLMKLFAVYVGGYEGDSSAPPTQLVLNYIRAIAVATGSVVLYGVFVDIMTEIAEALLVAINSNLTVVDIIETLVDGFSNSLNLLVGIMRLVFFICFIILLVKFFVMGAELFVLRMFLPFACVGLVDSDKGIFAPVLKQMLNVGITAVVQIIILRLAMYVVSKEQILPALAFIMLAMKTPQTMQFIMFTGSGGGGVGRAVTMAYYLRGLLTRRAVGR